MPGGLLLPCIVMVIACFLYDDAVLLFYFPAPDNVKNKKNGIHIYVDFAHILWKRKYHDKDRKMRFIH